MGPSFWDADGGVVEEAVAGAVKEAVIEVSDDFEVGGIMIGDSVEGNGDEAVSLTAVETEDFNVEDIDERVVVGRGVLVPGLIFLV